MHARNYRIIIGVVIVVGWMFLVAQAEAKDALPSVLTQTGEAAHIWKGKVGAGFRKGTLSREFAVGAGPSTDAFGGKEDHKLAHIVGHLGRIVTDVLGENRWYSGNLELWGELFASVQYDPMHRYVAGLTVGPRYHFVTNTAWVPYVDAGAGISFTDIGEPDLGGKFQFNTQAGIGTHYFIGENLTINLQTRLFHLSNAGLNSPNQGTNSILFLAGFSWFF